MSGKSIRSVPFCICQDDDGSHTSGFVFSLSPISIHCSLFLVSVAHVQLLYHAAGWFCHIPSALGFAGE